MHELIYIITILYSVYVINSVIGEEIIRFIHDTFHLDLGHYHATLKKLEQQFKSILVNKRITIEKS